MSGTFALQTRRFLTDQSIGCRVAAHAVQQQLVEPVCKFVGFSPRPQPRVGPVRRGEREQGRGRIVQVATQLAELPALPKERANPLLVAAALLENLFPPLAVEVAPLLN